MEIVTICMAPDAMAVFLASAEMVASQGSNEGELVTTAYDGTLFTWMWDLAKQKFCFVGEAL